MKKKSKVGTMKKLFTEREVCLDAKAIKDLRNSNLTIKQFKRRYNIK